MSVYVVFFGGYKATQEDMNKWLGSAKAQKPHVEFSAYPYPSGATADGDSAVHAFKNKKSGHFQAAVAAIRASSADSIYIVGHSSGCAIADAVDLELVDNKKLVLVVLDGFSPTSKKQLELSSTQFWSAESEDGHAKSLNYNSLANKVGKRLNVYRAKNCTTKWSLHFSLVNANTTDETVKTVHDIKNGYANCKANLAWL